MQEVELREEVRQLREEVAQLRRLVEAMAEGAHAAANLTVAAKEPAKPAVGVSDEVLAILAASISAFLGNKARIRHVRPVSSGLDSWRIQGRLAIQGSHNVRS